MSLLLRYEQFCTVLRSHPHAAVIRSCTFKTYDPNLHDLDRSYDYDSIKDNLEGDIVCEKDDNASGKGGSGSEFSDEIEDVDSELGGNDPLLETTITTHHKTRTHRHGFWSLLI